MIPPQKKLNHTIHSLPRLGDVTTTTNLSYDSFMKFRTTSRIFGRKSEDAALPVEVVAGSDEDSAVLKTVGWISAGLGAVALGLFVGRELRQRYKFNRRTPYDFYAHSGDEQDIDFGLGI
ncbi:hypothetical protein BH10ACI4_BH10ACI4_15330 [soil metagenome]